jgi:hypothetical protein
MSPIFAYPGSQLFMDGIVCWAQRTAVRRSSVPEMRRK